MRLFCGVFPPAQVQRDLHAALEYAPRGARLRWTSAERMHLTLAFLGEVSTPDADRVRDALDLAVRSRSRFELCLRGLGGFPDLRRPRVLHIGVAEGAEALRGLAGAVGATLPEELRPPDADRFRPHLTVARPKRPVPEAALAELRAELEPWSWRFEVVAVDLVRSHLDGPSHRYEVLHRAPLGA